ncbi:MAG: hypothetical protein AAF639_41945 [Chloroflexota bacterium]
MRSITKQIAKSTWSATGYASARLLFLAMLLTMFLTIFLATLLTPQSATTYANVPNNTPIDTDITIDTTWTVAGSPYVLADDITVHTGATLTIQPGVVVQQAGSIRSLIIQGHLDAVGTEDNSIIFTSDEDSGAEQWRGIQFDSGTGHLSHVIVRHGGQNSTPAIHIEGVAIDGQVLIENSTLSQNHGYGIQVKPNFLHRVEFRSNTFEGNRLGNGVAVERGAVSSDATLLDPGTPSAYLLLDDIDVSSGVTLTVEAGVLMQQVSTIRSLTIQGHLEAVGTANQPIIFTSNEDSGAEQWRGIVFDAGTGNLRHVIVRHGGQNSTPAIHIQSVAQDGQVVVEESTLDQNHGYGIQVRPAALHRVRFGNNTFTGNRFGNAVAVEGGDIDNTATLLVPGTPPSYHLLSDVTVGTGVTLTLQAGVMMQQVNSIRSLTIQGHLEAVGTTGNPIIFTSDEDTEAEQWRGIVFDNGTGHLSHTIVRNGGQNSTPSIHIQSVPAGGEVLIEESTLHQNHGYGIQVAPSALHRVRFGNNTFTSNRLGNGVAIESGSVGNSATLLVPGTPPAYLLLSDLTVNTDVTLTVQPGVMVQQTNSIRSLTIQGHLEAVGTAATPIIFTSDEDTAAEQWRSIEFENGSGQLAHVVVRHGGQNSTPGIHIQSVTQGKQVVVKNSTLSQNHGYGIQVRESALHAVELGGNLFEDNRLGNGVAIESGTIDTSATLFNPGTPPAYLLLGDVTVGDGVVLTINSGVMMQQTSSIRSLTIEGQLDALGTVANPIIFTSDEDNGAQQWRSIVFNDSVGTLRNVIVRHGGQNSSPALDVNNSQVTLDCSQIVDNHGDGIRIRGAAPSLSMSNVTVDGNGGDGLDNQSSVQIDVRNTWWGAANGPGGIGPGTGNAVQGDVLFDPWLIAAPPADCGQAPSSPTSTPTLTPTPTSTPTQVVIVDPGTQTPIPTPTPILTATPTATLDPLEFDGTPPPTEPVPTSTSVPTSTPAPTSTPPPPTATPNPEEEEPICCAINVIFFGGCFANHAQAASADASADTTISALMPAFITNEIAVGSPAQNEPPVETYTRFRDETLSSTQTGYGYIALYEKHTNELVNILDADIELNARVEAFLVDAADEFDSLSVDATEGAVLSQALVDEANAIVDALVAAGSDVFGADIAATWETMALDEQVDQETKAVWQAIQQQSLYLPIVNR